jgi:hypothetical protein
MESQQFGLDAKQWTIVRQALKYTVASLDRDDIFFKTECERLLKLLEHKNGNQ